MSAILAGHFPWLPPTPKPRGKGAKLPIRYFAGNHTPRKEGLKMRTWRQYTEARIDGNWVFA